MTTLAALLAALWAFTAACVWRGRRVFSLVQESPSATKAPDAWPSVSVIVACRDEERHVANTLESLLSIDYPDFEVIAVDDRSRDRTGEIIASLSATDERITPLTVSTLPPDWLGKPHAQNLAANHARGDWLLFTDADVLHHPQLLRTTISRAITRDLDYLTVIPHNETESAWVRCLMTQAFTLLVLLLGLWTSSRRRQSWEAVGAGAYMLLRRNLYEAMGGHSRLKLAVIDDVELGRAVRRFGGRYEMAYAGRWCQVPWSPTLPEMFRVTRKNAFAAVGFSWPLLIVATIVLVALNCLLPVFGVFHSSLWIAAVVAWLSLALMYAALAPVTGTASWSFMAHPITVVVGLAALWNSALTISQAGGIDWRDTFYPLKKLRPCTSGTSGETERATRRGVDTDGSAL